MRRRFCPLILGLFVLVGLPRSAEAHRLVADYSVLPGHRVQVESWFDPTGNGARDAHVQVLHADGAVLVQGTMNTEGVFVFAYERAEPLKIIVSAGAGHRAEVQIPACELGGTSSAGTATSTLAAQTGKPRLSHQPRETWKDILTGFSFLLALAAFVLSVRNSQHLRRVSERAGGVNPLEEVNQTGR
jgi:hypothetical protein